MTSYGSCAEALHKTRKECAGLTGDARTACELERNVASTPDLVKGCDAAITCGMSGYTSKKYTCVPGSTEPQVVHGLPLQSKRSYVP